MRYRTILLLLLTVVSIECNSGNVTMNSVEANSAEIITIPDAFDVRQPLDNLMNDLSVVILETTPESVLGKIESVVVTSSNIYVNDYALNYGPAVFDIDGKFIKRLPHGQAPCEIGATGNIFFDASDDTFCVYDAGNHKLVKYDKNGDFIDFHYFEYLLSDFAIVDSSILSLQPSYQNPVDEITIIKDDTIREKVTLWQLGKEKYDLSKTCYFQPCDDGIIINLPYDNNIYLYKNDSIRIKYKVVNKSKIDMSAFEKEWDMLKSIEDDDYVYCGDCIESANYQYLKYVTKEPIGAVSAYMIRNKNTKAITPRIDRGNSIIDLIKIYGFQKEHKDVFVGVIESSVLREHPNPQYRWDGSNPNNLISDEDMAKLKAVKPDDNPIIVLFKLKDDI